MCIYSPNPRKKKGRRDSGRDGDADAKGRKEGRDVRVAVKSDVVMVLIWC